jgi:DNA-binding response OmpR family regulator
MKKILVAEDDRFLLSAYNIKLKREGFEIITAMDGEEVLAVLKKVKPDLIILDLIMPKKDGFTVLKELKANEKWRDIPVLVASNLGQEEDIQLCKELGAADFIVKSDLSMTDLIEKIKKLLSM